MMSVQGGDSEPVFHTLAANDLSAGVATALGIYAREHIGADQQVATSLAAVSAYMLSGQLVDFDGRDPVRKGGRDFAGRSPLSRFYEVSDGWVRLHVERVESLIDAGLLADTSEDVEKALSSALGELDAQDVVDRVTEAGAYAVRARTFAEIAHDPTVAEGQYLDPVIRQDGKKFLFPGRHARFGRSARSAELTFTGLGEHSRVVLRDAGFTDSEIEALRAHGVIAADGDPCGSRSPPTVDHEASHSVHEVVTAPGQWSSRPVEPHGPEVRA